MLGLHQECSNSPTTARSRDASLAVELWTARPFQGCQPGSRAVKLLSCLLCCSLYTCQRGNQTIRPLPERQSPPPPYYLSHSPPCDAGVTRVLVGVNVETKLPADRVTKGTGTGIELGTELGTEVEVSSPELPPPVLSCPGGGSVLAAIRRSIHWSCSRVNGGNWSTLSPSSAIPLNAEHCPRCRILLLCCHLEHCRLKDRSTSAAAAPLALEFISGYHTVTALHPGLIHAAAQILVVNLL